MNRRTVTLLQDRTAIRPRRPKRGERMPRSASQAEAPVAKGDLSATKSRKGLHYSFMLCCFASFRVIGVMYVGFKP